MDALSWAANAGTSRIKGKVLYANLNTCFDFGAAFAIFFEPPLTTAPDDKRRARNALNCILTRQTEGAKNYEL